jgi:hypothetical protein
MPNLWEAVAPRVMHSRTVTASLLDRAWVGDVFGARTVQVIMYIRIWDLLVDFTLFEVLDRFI